MLQALAHAVDALVAIDVSGACDSEIRETLIAVRREIDRQHALVAQLLAAVHQCGLAAGDGASSTATWMRTQTGQRVNEAQASLQAGLACATLPRTRPANRRAAIVQPPRTLGSQSCGQMIFSCDPEN